MKKNILILLLAFILIFLMGFLFFYLKIRNLTKVEPEKNIDAIIVLGAGINGTSPSNTLAMRLKIAFNYLEENPNTIVVVSGGQGADEIVSEAYVMENYLLEKGISASRIILEDKSTSTKENFEFSKKLLDKHFKNTSYKIIFSTNDFHTLRSSMYAKDMGLNASPIFFKTRKDLVPLYFFREYLATIKYIILG